MAGADGPGGGVRGIPLLVLGAVLMAPWAVEAHGDPTVPRHLTVEIVEGTGVALSWEAPSEDAESVTGYQILRRRPLQGEPKPTVHVADTGSTATTYTDEDATAAGEQYNYRVKALRGDWESDTSNLARVTLPQAEPEPLQTGPPEDDTPVWTEQQLGPLGLMAKAGAGFVQLSWDAPVGDAESVTGYEVLRRRPKLGETLLTTLVADTDTADTSFVDATANEEGVDYEYRVRARRSADVSKGSNLATAVGQEAATTEFPHPESTDPAQRIVSPNPPPEPASVVFGGCGIDGPVEVEDPDDLRLPDLVACTPEYSVAEVIVAPDGTELHALRFAGFVTNLGSGPLDLKGNPQLADDADPTSHDVWQRALAVDGNWVNLGNRPPIKFERADAHNHFHVFGIVEYSLWDASGTVEIRPGAKIGFCLIDVVKRSELHPNPGPQRYKEHNPDIRFCKQGRPGAKNLRMGISEGWQDIYAFSMPLQWIDVSDVRPGYYRVGQRADPDNFIVESDETNNGVALSRRLHVVPGYVARPETVRVEPDAAVRFELSADEYYVDGSFEIESARAHRIVAQPSHGSLDVGDTVNVIIGGATHQVFTDQWVTYTPDPGYAGVDSFTFVALDELHPGYPINPVVARVTLDISGLDATVTIDNAPARIVAGFSFDLDATVNGATNDVTWSVDGVEGGSDEAGAIDADGRYSAPVVPPVSGNVTVRAASTQAPAAYAEVEIAIVEPAPASGKPIIEGIEEVTRTLSASTSEIRDSNGVYTTTYSYQWIRNDGTAAMDIPGATSSQYTLTTDDLGKTIAVRVSFTDDLGFPETLTSSHTSAVAVLANNVASGAPIIGGLDNLGLSLHLDISGISDADGLANVTYSYQWISNDGTADTDISGATSPTYTIRRGDHHKRIAVRVSFVDDMGFSETLTSERTSVVSFPHTSNRPNFAPTGAPSISGVPNVGATLTADTSSISDMNNLVSATFSYQWIAHDGTKYKNIPGATSGYHVITTDDVGKLIAVKVSFTDDVAFPESLTSEPTMRVLDTSPRPATGAPIIHGTAEVAETLTADTSGIWDPNGFDNANLSYQWISNDGTADTDIPGETSSDYTLTVDDVGKEMAVRVSFMDFRGTLEVLTSEPTDTVTASLVLTLAAANVNEDSLVLTYGEAMDETVSLPVSAFAVTVDGNVRPVAGTSVSGSAVTLVLATQVQADQVVLVSYTKPAGQDYIRNTLGHAGESFVGQEVTNDTQPPGVPQSPTATANEDGTVSLTWDDPGDPSITGYQVLRHITGVDSPGAFSILVDDTGSAVPSYLDGSVTAGTNYIYAVRARSRNGLSDRSPNVAVDTPAPPLLSMSDGSAAEGSDVEFTVTLSKESVDSVTVQYSTSDGTATEDVNAADGQDYTPASGQTLTFARGETVKTIGIPQATTWSTRMTRPSR